jgi:hypothetical protein
VQATAAPRRRKSVLSADKVKRVMVRLLAGERADRPKQALTFCPTALPFRQKSARERSQRGSPGAYSRRRAKRPDQKKCTHQQKNCPTGHQ